MTLLDYSFVFIFSIIGLGVAALYIWGMVNLYIWTRNRVAEIREEDRRDRIRTESEINRILGSEGGRKWLL